LKLGTMSTEMTTFESEMEGELPYDPRDYPDGFHPELYDL